jgi:hypothetical protein
MARSIIKIGALAGLLWIVAPAHADDPVQLEFTRLLAHWAEYAHPDYLAFIEDAQPEVAQVGFYGAHFWSLGHTAQYSGYPAHFPVRGLDKLGAWFEDLNAKLHARGVKVVGHFNVEFWSVIPRARTARAVSSSSTVTCGTRRHSVPSPSPTPCDC